jgi:hypothetical protein
MVTELQFVAVAAFLIWGLVASLCGVLTAAPDAVHLVKRDRGTEQEGPSIDPSLEAHETWPSGEARLQ